MDDRMVTKDDLCLINQLFPCLDKLTLSILRCDFDFSHFSSLKVLNILQISDGIDINFPKDLKLSLDIRPSSIELIEILTRFDKISDVEVRVNCLVIEQHQTIERADKLLSVDAKQINGYRLLGVSK